MLCPTCSRKCVGFEIKGKPVYVSCRFCDGEFFYTRARHDVEMATLDSWDSSVSAAIGNRKMSGIAALPVIESIEAARRTAKGFLFMTRQRAQESEQRRKANVSTMSRQEFHASLREKGIEIVDE